MPGVSFEVTERTRITGRYSGAHVGFHVAEWRAMDESDRPLGTCRTNGSSIIGLTEIFAELRVVDGDVVTVVLAPDSGVVRFSVS